ncbi:MAG: SRPBCC family protein [Planctomycetota bacterium]|nr:SRPBCC family protein [Planctomycetota bacterium]
MTAAPLTLRDQIAQFDPSLAIEAATPPPASWYTEPAFRPFERDAVFANSWQIVGRLGQVPEVGDYFTGSLARRPFLVTRDQDGELRGFYNVCAHHGTCVAKGHGRVEHFTCPYHGWEYKLDGALKRAPLAGEVGAFRTGTVGLRPIPIATLGGFVLLHFGSNPQDPNEQFASLRSELDALALDSLTFVTTREYELQCNWKVFVDNYLDGGYHVPHMHPGLCAQLSFEDYEVRLGDRYSVQTCPAEDHDRLGDLAHYIWTYPNFMINRYGSWADTNLVLPIDERRCRVVFDYYHEGEASEQELESALHDSDRVQQEDSEVVGLVQEGLESGVYEGLYASRFEAPMYHFHQLLAQDLRAGLLS